MLELYPGVLANLLMLVGLLLLASSDIGKSKASKLVIACLFAFVNVKYLQWRLDETLPAYELSFQSMWMWFFFVTEALAAIALNWHFFIMVAPTNRSPEADQWEKILKSSDNLDAVDVMIPTVNEPLAMLEKTIQGALNLDYPKVNVWVLDDGNREFLKDYCNGIGVNYIAREENIHYKAGNLNNALTLTQAPIICVVDADFVLEPNFLWRTVGLLNDAGIGLVQTPQVFSNPDAIQHNLGGSHAWPESQCAFSDVIQSGRDRWDNAFCYGTSFVVKRECLDAIGGFAKDSVTEDLLTSYVLHGAGYKTRFLNEPLSKGNATQDIAEYIRQRGRWCIGTIQCLFADRGLLRSRSLSLVDRLFLLDPIVYHFGTIWTLLLLVSPMMYWWFGIAPFHSDFGHLLIVLAPRMLLVTFGFYWLSQKKTIPIVSEVGRVVGVFHLTSSIIKALLNPYKQTFRSTIKHTEGADNIIYWQILLPLLGLALLTVLGVIARYLNLLDNDILWRTDFGLMVTLTIYVLWLLYLSCLVCVQRKITSSDDAVYVGSVRKTAKTLIKRMFA
ncbi:glycosyltransferase family 2 protein [Arenicella xantha]|uniref:Cellulose synthase (UDP-forming) n=1 Tax=Arenicella xantha TaxID=644221 RepID=A0A395JK76_9GAMM|nr:cellulose synthase catalytic subunit [Arenicella xantha]RBP51183.1 cellulose synthase (UDP-forming) [Arenicella xantha]